MLGWLGLLWALRANGIFVVGTLEYCDFPSGAGCSEGGFEIVYNAGPVVLCASAVRVEGAAEYSGLAELVEEG